jgi:polysaccharide biosynthesis protein PslH
MNVLLISRCPPYPLHLGDRLILWHLTRELRAMGVRFDLLALADRAEDGAETGHYAGQYGRLALFPDPPRTLASYARRALVPGARWPRTARAAWSPALWRAIETWRGERCYDLVHLFGGVQVYEFAHALGGLPAIITPYESYTLLLERELAAGGGLATRLRAAMAARFEAFMFTPYRQAVVLAEPDRQRLLALNPDLPLSVIPNGVDLATFAPMDLPRRTETIVFVGNYAYGPNHDAALLLARDILPEVQAAVPGARLQLVGHAPPPDLLALASPDVQVTGRVEDVRPYLAAAGVFASPLRTGAGIKNKILEAMAMATPVVASPISMDGIAARPGQDVLVAQPDAFAAAIVQVMRDDALRAQLAGARRVVVDGYGWEAVARQYLSLYERTLAGYRPGA